MKQYAVLHIDKMKIDKHIVGQDQHLKRTSKKSQKVSNPARIHLNEDYIVKPKKSLLNDIRDRIQEGYKHKNKDGTMRKINKSAIRACRVILSGTHERMKEIEADKILFEQWKKANYEFACKEWGEKNVVRMTLHMDEKTPHFHCVFVPLTRDGRLSADEIVGNAKSLQDIQDRYAKAMKVFGLERGISNKITGRTHETVEEWRAKQSTSVEKVKKITDQIKPTNVFKMQDIRKRVNRVFLSTYEENRELQSKNSKLEITFSNVMKNRIDEDIKRAKFEVSLVQHAARMGYEIDKSKGIRGAWLAMKKGADRILVLKEPNRNGYYYKSTVNDSDKGTIVDFMLNRGYGYEDVRKLASSHAHEENIKYINKHAKDRILDRELAQKVARDKYKTYIYSTNNYLKHRGIREDVMTDMKVRANEKGAIFPLTLDGKLCSTIEYTKQGKYFQAALPRGVCMLGEQKKPTRIVVTESPVDALSYEQMRRDKKKSSCDTLYVATCGSLSNQINKEIKKCTEMHPKAQVVLAFDNDEAGVKMQEKVTVMLKGRKVKVHKPSHGKDFNDMLQMLTKQERMGRRQLDREDEDDELTHQRGRYRGQRKR